jgi:pyruvate,water dikinase
MTESSQAHGSEVLTLEGRANAPGSACGPLCRNTPDLAPAGADGTILVAERAVPDDVGRILASAGTLTLGGAVLSHVSLLSREFGKPSVSLAGSGDVRLLPPGREGLLELRDLVGDPDQPVLSEGDVVILDGDEGVVRVPGGADRSLRARIRAVYGPLSLFGRHPGDRSLLQAVLTSLGDDRATVLNFLLEAAVVHGMAPSGDAARFLLEALRADEERRPLVEERLRMMRESLLASARRWCEEASEEIGSTTAIEDLQRRQRRIEEVFEAKRRLMVDLGGPTGPLGELAGRIRRLGGARRKALRARVREEAAKVLALSDEALAARVGGLYQLLRRARAASLERDVVDRIQEILARHVAQERARAGEHLVVPLSPGEGSRDRSLVGGKAAGLLHTFPILPDGCEIPRGFVITSSAYRLHLLGETGEKLRRATESGPDEAVISRLARAAILSGEIPREVASAVGKEAAELGDVRLAVRSSATVEDGPAGSLAGQFDTCLGVRGLEALLDRTRWAWASLWNARAVRTLAARGRTPLRAAQAVLVQEMIETRAAGVLFSREPAGRPDTLLINASWGLGEGISQGEVGGELYWVRRSTGAIIASEPSEGRAMIVLDPDRAGTVESEVPADRAGRPCLDGDDLGRLAELARVLEEATGRSQDVEFGFREDGTLMVFQVRRVVPRRPR